MTRKPPPMRPTVSPPASPAGLARPDSDVGLCKLLQILVEPPVPGVHPDPGGHDTHHDASGESDLRAQPPARVSRDTCSQPAYQSAHRASLVKAEHTLGQRRQWSWFGSCHHGLFAWLRPAASSARRGAVRPRSGTAPRRRPAAPAGRPGPSSRARSGTWSSRCGIDCPACVPSGLRAR